jgi:hypothetical protein
VETKAALIGSQRARELDAEASVDVDVAAVVLPRDLEDDLPFGLAEPLEDPGVDVLGVLLDHRREAPEHLVDGLVEFVLAGVAAENVCIHCLELRG